MVTFSFSFHFLLIFFIFGKKTYQRHHSDWLDCRANTQCPTLLMFLLLHFDGVDHECKILKMQRVRGKACPQVLQLCYKWFLLLLLFFFYIFYDRIPKMRKFTLTPSPQSPAPTLIFPVLLQYYSSSKAVISSPFCYLSVSWHCGHGQCQKTQHPID